MSVVKINAITVADGRGAELEERFAGRAGEVESMPGFLGFQLLRPTAGEERYFVVTEWESEEAFRGWVGSDAFRRGHACPARPGVRWRRTPTCSSSRSRSAPAGTPARTRPRTARGRPARRSSR